jgi:hypothetical protein
MNAAITTIVNVRIKKTHTTRDEETEMVVEMEVETMIDVNHGRTILAMSDLE